jgi:hypothetical protein
MKFPKKEIHNYQKQKKMMEITKKGNGLKGKVFPKKEIFFKKSEKNNKNYQKRKLPN